jgi:spore coat protein CotH
MGARAPLVLSLLTVLGCRPPAVLTPMDSGDSTPGPVDSDEPDDSGETDTIPDAPDPSDAIFTGDELPVFTIRVHVDAANQLQKEYAGGEHEWVEASFLHGDREYAPVGIRLKGENSFESFREKPSLKVDFDRFDGALAFLGLDGLTLNNMDNDYSMMHERIAYRVYREAGVPAYRVNHALLYVQEIDDEGEIRSDRFYGLYALLEDANKDMIGRWFDDPDGTLWEIWDVDFYDGYVPCPNTYGSGGCFELEYGEENREPIQGVADAMELSGSAAIEAADPHFDWEAWRAYWAAGSLVAQFDAYPYSSPGDDCHIFHDPSSGKLVFIPHGADETFYYPDHDFTSVNGIVAQRCKADPDCFAAYKARTWAAYDGALAWDWLGWFDEVQAQIEPWIEADTNRPYTDEYVDYYQDWMRDFIQGREAALEAHLGPR